MRGPTCIFWANLTPSSLKVYAYSRTGRAPATPAGQSGALAADLGGTSTTAGCRGSPRSCGRCWAQARCSTPTSGKVIKCSSPLNAATISVGCYYQTAEWCSCQFPTPTRLGCTTPQGDYFQGSKRGRHTHSRSHPQSRGTLYMYMYYSPTTASYEWELGYD
jgi:hypothetical protein